jgi:hypothetical protein
MHPQHALAGALDLATGTLHHSWGPRKTTALFRDLLGLLEVKDPAERYTRVYVVVATSKIHNAKAVEQWLAAHPWVTRLLLPTYCPQANPLERAFGDVHDLCPRNHMRRRLQELVADVAKHRHGHGPWLYKLADISYQPAVTTAVENMTAEEQSPWAT